MQFLIGNEQIIERSLRDIESLCPNLKISLHDRRYFDYGVLYLLERGLGGVPPKDLIDKRKKIVALKIDGEKNPWKIKNGTLCLKKNNCLGIDDTTLKAAVDQVAKAGIANIQLAQYQALRSLKGDHSFSGEAKRTPGLLY